MLSLFKEKFTQKWKLNHDLIIPMLMEKKVKFHSSQNISSALQQNSILVFSQTTEVAGDWHHTVCWA